MTWESRLYESPRVTPRRLSRRERRARLARVIVVTVAALAALYLVRRFV